MVMEICSKGDEDFGWEFFRSVSSNVVVGVVCMQLCGSLIPTRREMAHVKMRLAQLTVTEIPLKVCCQSAIH